MDFDSVARRLESGERLKIMYRYPTTDASADSECRTCGVRSDRLVDVSVERKRFYVKFRGTTAIWIEESEVVEITVDDGVYQESTTA